MVCVLHSTAPGREGPSWALVTEGCRPPKGRPCGRRDNGPQRGPLSWSLEPVDITYMAKAALLMWLHRNLFPVPLPDWAGTQARVLVSPARGDLAGPAMSLWWRTLP